MTFAALVDLASSHSAEVQNLGRAGQGQGRAATPQRPGALAAGSVRGPRLAPGRRTFPMKAFRTFFMDFDVSRPVCYFQMFLFFFRPVFMQT